MGWKSTTPMEEKVKFIRAWQSQQFTVSELCKAFEISRTTGHKLIRSFQKYGEECFLSKSKRPYNSPYKTPGEIEDRIIQLRNKHVNWGARKLRVLLLREFEENKIPSESTINSILKGNGLVKSRRKRRPPIDKLNPKFNPSTCNEIWSADYKGKFKMGNKRYCYPLTISDSYSRYVFITDGHYHPTFVAAKRSYTTAFKEFGLPHYIHTDNGVPFASYHSVCRFSRLSYWLIYLGVYPLFSDPGCPQQNGRHERMHRDLKAFCTKPPQTTMSKQQIVLNTFRDEYNEVRPHESLDMLTPYDVNVCSNRSFPRKIVPYDYDYNFRKLKVTKNGSIRWGKHNWVYISRGAVGRYVGLEELGNGIWKVFYRDVLLGLFDEKLITKREQHLKLTNIIV